MSDLFGGSKSKGGPPRAVLDAYTDNLARAQGTAENLQPMPVAPTHMDQYAGQALLYRTLGLPPPGIPGAGMGMPPRQSYPGMGAQPQMNNMMMPPQQPQPGMWQQGGSPIGNAVSFAQDPMERMREMLRAHDPDGQDMGHNTFLPTHPMHQQQPESAHAFARAASGTPQQQQPEGPPPGFRAPPPQYPQGVGFGGAEGYTMPARGADSLMQLIGRLQQGLGGNPFMGRI